MKRIFDKKYGKEVIKIEYIDEQDKERKIQEYSDLVLIGEENLIDGNFLVFETPEESLKRLKEELAEKLLLDEDITEVKEKIKKLKEKFEVEEI